MDSANFKGYPKFKIAKETYLTWSSPGMHSIKICDCWQLVIVTSPFDKYVADNDEPACQWHKRQQQREN